MRIGVAATAPFGADVLERLAARHEIAFLLTRPDAPRGRGRKLARAAGEGGGGAARDPGAPARGAGAARRRSSAVVVCAYGLSSRRRCSRGRSG